MATLILNPQFQAFDDNGDPLSGGKLYTYKAGTSTDKATYSDRALTTPNTNPVILDSRGEATIYGAGVYKLLLKDSDDVQIWSVDHVQGIGNSAFTSVSDYLSIHEAISSIGATEITLYIDDDVTMTQNDTIPSTMTLKVLHGAQIDGAFTLEINGSIDAGLYQIFGSSLTVTGNGISDAYPEYWGAAADGVTDDYTALNAAITYVKQTDNTSYLTSSSLVLTANKIYKVGTTLFLGNSTSNTGVRRVVASGGGKATILGSGITGPIIDWTGVNRKVMKNIEIYGDAASPPDIGILLARNNQGNSQSSGLTTLDHVDIEGTFDTAGIYNYGSEDLRAKYGIWRATTPVLYVGTRENTKYAVTLPNSTATGSLSNTNFSFEHIQFINLAASGTAVAGVELMGVTSATFDQNCLFDTSTAGDIPSVWIHEESLNNSYINIINSVFHSTYDIGVLLEDDPTFIKIKDNRWGVSATTAEIVGGSATGTITLDSSILEAPNIDFSDATADITGNSVVTAGTSLNIARKAEGDIYVPNAASLTLGGLGIQTLATIHYTDNGQTYRNLSDKTTVVAAATSGIGEDDLISDTIAAGEWKPGRGIRIVGGGDVTGANGTKTIKLYIGSSSYTIVPAENLATTSEWTFDVTLYANTTSAQKGSGGAHAALAMKWHDGNISPAQDLTNALTIKCTGEVADAGDTITQRFLSVIPL